MNGGLALASNSVRIPAMRCALTIGVFVIGRSSKCDFVVRDSTVSRRHAEIVVCRASVVVRDLDSRNGTFIDAKRIETESLYKNQSVTFGSVSFLLTNETCEQESESDVETAKCGRPSPFSDCGLSKGQHRVLSALLEGFSDKEIARQLHRSDRTVHNHVQAIYRTLNVHSRPELLARFLKTRT
jgi:DNA-binding CsgD family transcriptional regulator